MWPFSTEDDSKLSKLFGSTALHYVARKEQVDQWPAAANGATEVDVAVTVSDPINLGSDTRAIGLTYWPDGPMVKGVQTIREGEQRVFRGVKVLRGGTLAVALDDDTPVTMDVIAVGAPAPPQASPSSPLGPLGDNPFKDLGQGLGQGLGTALAMGLLAFLGYQLLMKEVAK